MWFNPYFSKMLCLFKSEDFSGYVFFEGTSISKGPEAEAV